MEGGWQLSPSRRPLLDADPLWPQAAARAAREDAQLQEVDTFTVQLPRNSAAISTNSPGAKASPTVVVGSFEWHFGDHGQALAPVRQLYKEACLAMSSVKLSEYFTVL